MVRFKTVNITFGIVFISLVIALSFVKVPLLIFLVLGISWLLIAVAGSFFIQWNYHFESLNKNPNISKNQVAITFDDGPHPEFTPQVLDLLKTYQAKASFFCIGKHIETYPELFKTIISQGHLIGNHTYSHSNSFGFFSTAKVISELERTNTIVKTISNINLKFYRPAFGVTNPNIKKALQIIGLQSIGWSKRSLDTTNLSEKKVLERVTRNLKKGDVILLHDTSQKSVAVLEQLLLFLQEKNLEVVTIDTLFDIDAYA